MSTRPGHRRSDGQPFSAACHRLIRYEVNDSVTLSAKVGRTALPFRQIESILGCPEDILYIAGAAGDCCPAAGGTISITQLNTSGWTILQEVVNLTGLLGGVPASFMDDTPVRSMMQKLTTEGCSSPRSPKIRFVISEPEK